MSGESRQQPAARGEDERDNLHVTARIIRSSAMSQDLTTAWLGRARGVHRGARAIGRAVCL